MMIVTVRDMEMSSHSMHSSVEKMYFHPTYNIAYVLLYSLLQKETRGNQSNMKMKSYSQRREYKKGIQGKILDTELAISFEANIMGIK